MKHTYFQLWQISTQKGTTAHVGKLSYQCGTTGDWSGTSQALLRWEAGADPGERGTRRSFLPLWRRHQISFISDTSPILFFLYLSWAPSLGRISEQFPKAYEDEIRTFSLTDTEVTSCKPRRKNEEIIKKKWQGIKGGCLYWEFWKAGCFYDRIESIDAPSGPKLHAECLHSIHKGLVGLYRPSVMCWACRSEQ